MEKQQVQYDDGIRVKLLYPIKSDEILQSLWTVWHTSKVGIGNIIPIYDYDSAINLFKKLIGVEIPILEFFQLTFMMENIPVFLREQMVRHKVMTSCGDNFGVDIIPDLSKSTWWSQSMRILNMGNFADSCEYYIPEQLENNEIYRKAMISCQNYYNELVENGIPLELARGVLPFAANHTIAWNMNLKIFMEIVGIRTCWILQTGIWSSVIKKMSDELINLDSNLFDGIALPRCFENGNFTGCKYCHENERRVNGLDILPPCPLYMYESEDYIFNKVNNSNDYDSIGLSIINHLSNSGNKILDYQVWLNDFVKRSNIYHGLWKRNLLTGDKDE